MTDIHSPLIIPPINTICVHNGMLIIARTCCGAIVAQEILSVNKLLATINMQCFLKYTLLKV